MPCCFSPIVIVLSIISIISAGKEFVRILHMASLIVSVAGKRKVHCNESYEVPVLF